MRIVLTTYGSLGDLHPYIGLALGLQARGHEPVLATGAFYRDKVEALGVRFAAVRPEIPNPFDNPALRKAVMDPRGGGHYILTKLVLPQLRGAFDDLRAVCAGADLVVSHMLTYAAPLAAEYHRLPWASTSLAPATLFSALDPPHLPGAAPLAAALNAIGPPAYRLGFRLAEALSRPWTLPWHRLRREFGLPPRRVNPILRGQFSPHLHLALFSEALGRPQPDWPANTVQAGFVFFDRHFWGDGGELRDFLAAGEPPVVFTLGSSAVLDAGPFYRHAAAAARRLGRRAVLLVGKGLGNELGGLPAGVVSAAYAPFSELFPRAAAVVHQGGVGTTAQALRAGVPMLVVPWAHDQSDNAERVRRLGVARTLPRGRLSVGGLERELGALLADPGYAERAAEVGRRVAAEDGVGAACAALERLARA